MAISVYTEDYLQRPLSPSGSRSKSLHLNISNLKDDNTVLKRRRRIYSHSYLHFISFVARSIDLVSFRLSFIFRRFI